MPTYRIKAPDGRTLRVTGDQPPTEQEMQEIFAATQPQQAEEIHPRMLLPEPGQEEVLDTYRRLPGEMAREAVNYLPQFGALAGTALSSPTGPGMVGGAALGGAAGEAARQLIQGGPQTSTEAAGRIGVEALKQGAMIGAPAAAGGSRAISPILRFAGRPSVQGATVAGVEMARGRDPITAAGEGVAVAGLSRALRGAPAAEAPVAARELPGDIQAMIRQELERTAPNIPGAAKLPKSVVARIEHQIARAAKEADSAASVAPGASRAAEGASKASPKIPPKAPTRYQLAKALQEEEGISLGEAQRRVAEGVRPKSMAPAEAPVERISDDAANKARHEAMRRFQESPADEQVAFLKNLVDGMKAQKFSAGQIAETVKSETGYTLYRARKITDWILDPSKIK